MSVISAVGIGRRDQPDFELNLHSQSQLFRERGAQYRYAAPEIIQRIEAGLRFFAGTWGAQKWPR